MVHSLMILTPGSFPIPYRVSSSVESSILEIVPYLGKKMRVTVLGKKFSVVPGQTNHKGVQFINFTAGKQQDYLRQAIHHIRNHPPDLVQIENRPNYVIPLKQELPHIRIWLSLHSTTFLHPSFIGRKRLILALHLADRILVNSHFLKNELTSIDPKIADKILVNHLGVDPSRFAPRDQQPVASFRDQIRKQLGLQNKQVILFVGRLIPIKGVHRLIQAIRDLKKHHSDFVVLIVGGSKYGKNSNTRYVQALKRLQSQQRRYVYFIPYVPNSQIHRWYQIADIFVTPSIGKEAFGLVNVEALSTGIPVVATKIGGIPEIIRHNQNGLLVPVRNHAKNLAQALHILLSHPDLAAKLGKEGRKQAETYFSWEQVAHRLLCLYETELDNASERT